MDIDRLMQEVLDLYRSAGVPLEVTRDTSGAQVRGDPLRLRQVIHNLIKNAQEALEGRDSPRISVATRLVEERDICFVQLEVADNGPGFEQHLLERLFEPYVTTKPKGTGLGLAIVKKIIEEHGGMIAVENTGEGARIRVCLPVWQVTATAVQGREQDITT